MGWDVMFHLHPKHPECPEGLSTVLGLARTPPRAAVRVLVLLFGMSSSLSPPLRPLISSQLGPVVSPWSGTISWDKRKASPFHVIWHTHTSHIPPSRAKHQRGGKRLHPST
jgi:hypothetical protein